MAFTPKKLNSTEINSGAEYKNGDGIVADDLNKIVEGVLYAQENGGSDSSITVDERLDDTSANPVQNKVITDRLNALQIKIEALSYKPIDIIRFSVTNPPSLPLEIGTIIPSVTLSWEVNKTPTTLTLDGVSINENSTSKTLTGLFLNKSTTYTLKATDERGETDTSVASINFYNGVYYGVASEPTSYDSEFIKGLTNKSLQGTKSKTFTVTAGANQYIYYALPSSYITDSNPIIFNVGGFDGGFTKVSTIQFTNANNRTEAYDIYKSDNANLGNTTVKVS